MLAARGNDTTEFNVLIEVGTTGQEQARKAIGLLGFRKEENSTSHTYDCPTLLLRTKRNNNFNNKIETALAGLLSTYWHPVISDSNARIICM